MAKKPAAITKAMSKSEILAALAEGTGLTKKDVGSVLDQLEAIIQRHLKKKGGAGTFVLPGLLKIKTVAVPAQKAQKNVPHPFKPGEFFDRPAKPASTKVKTLALKKLKSMV